MAPDCWLCGSMGVGFRKGTMVSVTFLSERKLSPALALMPDTSVPPHMSLVPFKLLPQWWSSERVSLSKPMCGFSKRSCWVLQKFLSLTQSPLVFAARSYGDLSSWHWNPWLWYLMWGCGSSSPRYPSWIFIHHTRCGTSPFCISTPPTSLSGCGFFNFMVVRLHSVWFLPVLSIFPCTKRWQVWSPESAHSWVVGSMKEAIDWYFPLTSMGFFFSHILSLKSIIKEVSWGND